MSPTIHTVRFLTKHRPPGLMNDGDAVYRDHLNKIQIYKTPKIYFSLENNLYFNGIFFWYIEIGLSDY